MVEIINESIFEKKIQKIKDAALKEKLKKQIRKIVENPTIGKPMMYERKRTREVYIHPFRLSYTYIESDNKIIFLDLYHKNEQ